ncbi:hypothetical protein Tco_0966821 [Tanacetum coccineum]
MASSTISMWKTLVVELLGLTSIHVEDKIINCQNPGMPHCNSFYWIDPELPNEWYKSQLLELYLTLDQEQRVLLAVSYAQRET